jgi:hypothetical protein
MSQPADILPMRRILVSGSRDWTDVDRVRNALRHAWAYLQPGPITLVHGAARGLDTIAGRVWTGGNLPVEVHPADWNKHGKGAGPIRNQAMVDLGADLLVAFPLGASIGTRDCIRRAKAAGIIVWEVEG